MSREFDCNCKYINTADDLCILGHNRCLSNCIDFELYEGEYIDDYDKFQENFQKEMQEVDNVIFKAINNGNS
mgnify:FL=1